MSKKYTQEEKEYMAEMAIEIVQKLDGHYPSFKNILPAYSISPPEIMAGDIILSA